MNKRLFSASLLLLLAVMSATAFSQKFPGFSKSKTGLYYKIYKTSGDTSTPRYGNYVTFDMLYHGNSHGKDSVFFNTRKGDHPEPVKMYLSTPGFKGDIFEGMINVALPPCFINEIPSSHPLIT